ncbi:SH3 domain-containing protein [Maritimibacter sp. DP1N21-5]|uniref:SH3 domain-containing protein n=1 Tax=Maritimibacter sp. DP1N21-5 TaxID=2836867 RepID=UPI001C45F6CF|nr:SH3 domain-containing protein [Maritimibacter sp. DP1N21-5]MBV7408355.1 SH3 domain-containing protein [Maritimibacter sp. DP1N21-5]
MDRRIFIATGLAAITLAGPATAQTHAVNSPRDGFLNLRTGPGEQFDIIGRMGHGSRVTILESAGSWVRVRHDSGTVGWCSARYLAALAVSPYYYVYSPGDGFLNLRTGPGTRYSIIGPMYNGEEVRILERAGEWVRVRHQSGTVGWCSSKYLRQ